MRHYIACAQRGESGEGKVHAIHQGAGEITLQVPPTIGLVHQEKGNGENPHLDGVGGERDKHAHDDPKPMRYFHPGHQQGDLVQKFIMNHHGKADHKKIYEDDSYHLFGALMLATVVYFTSFMPPQKSPVGDEALYTDMVPGDRIELPTRGFSILERGSIGITHLWYDPPLNYSVIL
jgi:hypothetical protein